MSLLGFILLVIIAAVVGAIGQALAGSSIGGLLGAILLGFIGAYLGVWIAGQLGLPPYFTVVVDGQPFPVVWAIVGAAILAFLFSLVVGRRRAYRR